MKAKSLFKTSGQSLSEYGTIFGVVIVVAIGAVAFLGTQNTQMYENVMQGGFGKSTDESGKLVSLGTLISSNNTDSQITATLKDGTILSLSRYPSNLAQSIETIGVDGTTRELLATLRSVANQLKSQGKITDAEYNQFAALANQGHRMANIEKLVEDLAQNSSSKETFRNQIIALDGKSYSPADLLCALGGVNESISNKACNSLTAPYDFSNAPLITEDPKVAAATANRYGQEQMAFLRAYEKVNALSQVKEDPTLQKVLLSLSQDITSLAQSMASVGNKIASLVEADFTPNQLKGSVASLVTNTQSARICNRGSTQDSGIHCPPN